MPRSTKGSITPDDFDKSDNTQNMIEKTRYEYLFLSKNIRYKIRERRKNMVDNKLLLAEIQATESTFAGCKAKSNVKISDRFFFFNNLLANIKTKIRLIR